MPESHHTEIIEVERPTSISHLVHTLRAYAPAIFLSWAAVALLYVVVAVALYAFSATQRISTQRFRLDFQGAPEGKYPNGTKFSSSDIVSTPVLLKVFQENQLGRFTNFPSFSRAMFVLESNPDYERLAADYSARLADARLSPVDRERVQKEWQAKSAAVAKNEYSVNWLRTSDTSKVPESLVKKVLLDTLSTWAHNAANEQHVLKYRLAVLSPQVVGLSDNDSEPVVAIQVLRSKIYKILGNIDDLRQVPGSELLRSAEGMSLEEIRLRLEELTRFRLEPLMGRVSSSGLITNRAATVRYLESQLAYDQRYLKAAQDGAEAIRQSLAVYSPDRSPMPETTTAGASPTREQTRTQQPRTESVTPQITEGFLDRLVALTSQSTDMQYRQRLVDDYLRASNSVIPIQQSVSYDQEVLNLVKSGSASSSPLQAADVRNEIVATQNELKTLVGKVNEIYGIISQNLSPSKELYTLNAPAITRAEHVTSLSRLALYGIGLLALSLPLIIIFCLVHARIRAEEEAEGYVAPHEAEAAT